MGTTSKQPGFLVTHAGGATMHSTMGGQSTTKNKRGVEKRMYTIGSQTHYNVNLGSKTISNEKASKELRMMRDKITHVYMSYMEIKRDLWEALCGLGNMVESITMVDAGIQQIPESIGNLKRLKLLNLRMNSIQWVTPALSKLDLIVLDLSSNKLENEALPLFYQLTTIETLNLSLNKFSGQMPDGIEALSRLRFLHLKGNEFTSLCNGMRLYNLIHLDITANKLEFLPPSLSGCFQRGTSLLAKGNQFDKKLEKLTRGDPKLLAEYIDSEQYKIMYISNKTKSGDQVPDDTYMYGNPNANNASDNE